MKQQKRIFYTGLRLRLNYKVAEEMNSNVKRE